MPACLCCAVDLPDSPAPDVCPACSSRSPRDIALAAAALCARQLATKQVTRAGRRQLRRDRLQAVIAAMGKKCTSCHGGKPALDFAACESRADGLQAECKACGRVRVALLATPGAGRDAWYTFRDSLRAQNTATKNNL